MFDLGSSWFRHGLFPTTAAPCPSCGKPFKVSSGVVGDESCNVAIYLAYLSAPYGVPKGLVQIRRPDLDDDSESGELTDIFEVETRDGNILIATKNGRKIEREVIATFTGDEDDDHLIDFIVRIDKHILQHLTGGMAK